MVRPATFDDLPAIVRIENEAILNGYAHFGTTPVALEDAQRAFQFARDRYPWVVAEVDGAIVGFARCGPWKTREGYRWTAEAGVYIDPEWQGKGIGKALYEHLFPAMEAIGLRTILAGIALPNPASVRLHESMGMVQTATFPRNGFKHGQWWDVGYWALTFGDGPPTRPEP